MGKVKKHTEYYCDICDQKIDGHCSPLSRRDLFYKIRCYGFTGHKLKFSAYEYVCGACMDSIVAKVREERRKL